MLVYKIVNRKTGLEWKSYTSAWNGAKWRKKGKVWSRLCAAKTALHYVPERDKPNAVIMFAYVGNWTELGDYIQGK